MVWLLGALAVAGTIGMVAETATMAVGAIAARHAVARSRYAAGARSEYLISPEQMDSAVAAVEQAVDERVVPGAAVAIGDRSRILAVRAFGRIGWRQADAAVTDSTMYDLASLTKAIATTSAVLLLVQDGRIHLDDPVQRWLPEFDGRWKDQVTWRDLLTHSSGLPPAGHMRGSTPAARLHSLLRTKLENPPGTHVQYSDLSFIVLWTAAERVAGEPLEHFLTRRLWAPLGMRHTAMWPGIDCTDCAPTMTLTSGEPYRGKPSDPIAHKLGEPSGNAGLFSSAHDLARFVAMIANGGVIDGRRILRADLVRALFEQQPHAAHRTLGWEAFCPEEHPTQEDACRRPVAYGHTGWTGTSVWVDPVRGVWAVILSNRSYDVKHPPSLDELREDVFMRVATGAAPREGAAAGDLARDAGGRDAVAH
ncbi:MAG TPA: serine hydrolase domain-containing protein [Gemmatimonadaceae bacterium]|nr:serine hydrolase domain-containing protein [Gemmatimonadaceae bacterium]